MPDSQKPVPALVISRAPIVNPDGTARWEFLKILQGWATQIANSLNSLGQFVGIIGSQAKVQGRVETIGLTLQNIGTDGVISTDNLTDGVGSPLAGGAVAFSSLVNSSPVPGNVLKYSGTDWTPGDAPGITQLTGDVTAGPGSGSEAAQVVATHLAAPLPVAQGGSGTSTPSLVGGANVTISGAWPNQTVAAAAGMANPMMAVGDLIVGGTAGAPTRLAAGTSGQVLTSNGPGAAPSYQPGGGGGVSSLNSLTGALSLVAGSNVTITPSGSNITIASSGGGGGGNMSYLGDWAAGSYALGSVVRYSGALYLCISSVSSAAPAFVQSAANVNSGTIAFPSNVTAGNLLVIGFGDEGTVDPSTVTDSQGNTWTKITAITGNANNLAMYCATAGSSGPCAVSFTTGGGWKKATIAEFSGTSPTVNTFSSVYGNSNPVTVPVTTTVGNCMIFAALAAFHSGETFGAVSPLTISSSAQGHDAVVGGYYLAVSALSTNIGFTLSNTGDSPLIAAAFEGGALPPPSDPGHWMVL